MIHECICPPKDMYLNVQCSFVYNDQKLKRNHMPFGWQTGKQIVA